MATLGGRLSLRAVKARPAAGKEAPPAKKPKPAAPAAVDREDGCAPPLQPPGPFGLKKSGGVHVAPGWA